MFVFLAAVSHLPPGNRDYFLDPGRLAQLYRLVDRPGDYFEAGRPSRTNYDLADFLRIAHTDEEHLYLPGPSALWFQSKKAAELGNYEVVSEDGARWLVSPDDWRLLRWLLGGDRAIENTRKYAMALKLERESPGLLSAETGVILRDRFLKIAPVVQVLAELRVDSRTAAKFLAYLINLSDATEDRDRWTSMGLVQGTLVILGGLARRDSVGPESLSELPMKLLERLHGGTSAVSLGDNIASFFTEDLDPVLGDAAVGSGSSLSERLLTTLLDPGMERRLYWGGHSLQVAPSSRVDAAKRFLRDQEIPDLDTVLESIRLAVLLREEREDALQPLMDAVQPLLRPRLPRESFSSEYRDEIEHVRIGELRSAVSDVRKEQTKREPNRERIRGRANELIGELSPYLSECLIGIVYALNAGPNNIVLAGDPDFVRKHSFEESSIPIGLRRPEDAGGPWGRPVLRKDA
ncbi:MAG: hypothetical protein P8Z74_21285, partial [Acidobacteriota bacterium]